MPTSHPVLALPPYADDGTLNVIIETAKGSRNKIDFDPKRGVYELAGVMPAGVAFPYDFGFIPSTLGEDGDPIDILVLMDEPVFAGCLVSSRLVGVITANQTERDGDTMRNDRLIAVSTRSHTHDEVKSLDDLPDALLHELEHFFKSYNDALGKVFEVLDRKGPRAAANLVEEGAARLRASRRKRQAKRSTTKRATTKRAAKKRSR